MKESADTVHGRLLEAVHITGYTFERACSELEWLLEDNRWKQVAGGFENINDFLKTIDLSEFKIAIDQRQKLAKKLKTLQASTRNTAKSLGFSHETIAADLRTVNNLPITQSGEEAAKAAAKAATSEIKKIERKQEIAELQKKIQEGEIVLPEGVFEVVIVDPPWPYGTKYDPESRRVGSPYPEMALHDIAKLQLPFADDCIVWLWTTHLFMRHAFLILDNWGFKERAILTWVKDRMGVGSWLRSQTEFCIMAIKGNPKVNLSNQTTILHAPLREHSRKPDEFYDLVISLCIGRILDYFAREPRPGIHVAGVETDKFLEQQTPSD